jgi:hypothetical protein
MCLFNRITSRFPDDPRQPFWVEDGTPMKPLAKLSLIRQRLYKKSCSADHDDVPFQEASSDFYDDHGNYSFVTWLFTIVYSPFSQVFIPIA